jgi:outer membrane protein assembly factor BamB
MKIITRLGIGLCFTAGLSFGVEMYTGQLMDASCYNQNSGSKPWAQCVPSASTTNFAIHTNGKVRMLDTAGDNKAEAAIQEGNLKLNKRGDMRVTIDGWRHGNTINVEGIHSPGSNVSVH